MGSQIFPAPIHRPEGFAPCGGFPGAAALPAAGADHHGLAQLPTATVAWHCGNVDRVDGKSWDDILVNSDG